MRNFRIFAFAFALAVTFAATAATAAAPSLISFQGRLKDSVGAIVADAGYSVVFTIYDAASGGTAVWTETQPVITKGGGFAVLLGAVNPILDSVFNGTTRYIGIAVAGDPEVAPRTAMVSVPYAQRVNTVDGASGGVITTKVSIGPGHTNTGTHAFVAGTGNTASSNYATVGGGQANSSGGLSATVSGGTANSAAGLGSTIGGGNFNTASQPRTTVGGGYTNSAGGSNATVSGGYTNMASGSNATVGGGGADTASGASSTIGGGNSNTASGNYTTVGGGLQNTASGEHATVGGGKGNTASGIIFVTGYSTVGGGQNNTASGDGATVGGGMSNTANDDAATVSGGINNIASGFQATVGGGVGNSASGMRATVCGGALNVAGGRYSFAAGNRAKAFHWGAFVWGDTTNSDVASTADNQFTARASGGVRFFSNAALTTGVTLAAGGGSWAAVSDRNLKSNFEAVDAQDVLARVAAMPMTTWNYTSQDESIRHMGPMAQDFRAAFGLGEDDTHITTIDADGVALAAIQGLNLKLEEQLRQRDDEIAALREELAGVKELVAGLAARLPGGADAQLGMK